MEKAKKLHQEGNYIEAFAQLENCLKLNPNNRAAIALQADYKKDRDNQIYRQEKALFNQTESRKKSGQRVYVFTRNLSSPRLDPRMALILAMSLYPQQRQLLPDQFEVLIKLVFDSMLQRMTEWHRLRREVERYVYISGYGPAQPEKTSQLVERVLEAIRLVKRAKISYRRIYDGEMVEREVEPYGLLKVESRCR